MSALASNGTAYELHGDQRAPLVVLIHGLGLNRHTWRDYVPTLSQDFGVLTYDLYGHGQSAPPPGQPSLGLFARQLFEVLQEVIDDGSRLAGCCLAGFSLGGMINRRFAMDYSQSVGSLIILNSPHERGEAAQRLVEQRAEHTAAGGPGATIDATLERWFTPSFRQKRSDVVDEVRQGVLANDSLIYAECRQVLAKGVVELIRPKPPITLPGLIMTCENDSGSTPQMSLAIAEEIAGSQTIIVPQLQHMGLLEQPSLFLAPMITFLSKSSSQA